MDIEPLLALIEQCRARGVIRLHLPDGTEFVLDPSHVPRRIEPSLPTAGAQGTINSAQSISAMSRNEVTDQIDTELFGKPLYTE